MIDTNKLWRKSPNKNGKKKASFVLFYDNCDSVIEKFKDNDSMLAEWFRSVVNYECYGDQPDTQKLIDKYGMKNAVDILSQFETTREKCDKAFSDWQDQCRANKHSP